MIGAGRGPSDRANFIQRGESERAVWCLPGGADLPMCAAAGAQLPGHWIRFGASLPHGRRRERPVGPGQFHSERRIRAGRVVPPGRCGFAMVRRSGGETARPLESIWASLPHDRRRERPVGPGQICHGAPQRGRNCPATGFDCGASRAVRICHGAPQRGRNCPATGFDLEPLCRMIAAGRGPSDRASFIQRGESERAVGPGQFHSERRIRAGRVVPPGRCGFAMVRRSGGATARPLDSIWSLSAA